LMSTAKHHRVYNQRQRLLMNPHLGLHQRHRNLLVPVADAAALALPYE
jgi:hypothetical protein